MLTVTPNMTKGLVPMPGHATVPFEQGAAHKINHVGMDELGPRHMEGICFHRSQGYGSVSWLLNPSVSGLTDWVISEKPAATMTQINFMTGTDRDLWGWAQGPINWPVASADVHAFVNLHGGNYNAWNGFIESIEVEGFYDDAVSEATYKKLAQMTASRAHDDGILWSQFPLRNNGLTFIYGHREACGTEYKLCPGSVVWAFINGPLIDRVQSILKSAQIGTIVNVPKPVYARARVPAFLKESPLPASPVLNGKTLTLVNKQYEAMEPTPVLSAASRDAKKVRTDMTVGEDTTIAYTWTAASEEWGLSKYGSRIPMKDMKPLAKTDAA